MLALVNEIAKRKNEALVGTRVEILCEGESKTNASRLMGRTRTNKIVIFEGSQRHIGQLFDVKITRAMGFSLYGDPASRSNKDIIARAQRMATVRNERYPLDVRFFDAASANVWGEAA